MASHQVNGPREFLELYDELQRLLTIGQHPVLAARFCRITLEQVLDAGVSTWIAFGYPTALSLAKRIPLLPASSMDPENLDAFRAALTRARERPAPPVPGSANWSSTLTEALAFLDREQAMLSDLLRGSGSGLPDGDPSVAPAATIRAPVVARPISQGPVHPLFAEERVSQIVAFAVDGHTTLERSSRPRLAIDGEVSSDARAAFENVLQVVEAFPAPGAPRCNHCGFHVAWNPREIRITGRSAALPVLLAAAEARSRLAPGYLERRLASLLAATGAVDGTTVKPVEPSTLRLKARAAFFSPVRTLCVPAAQRGLALEEVRALEQIHPARQLMIEGVADARELWSDRTFTRPHPRTRRRALGATAQWVRGSRVALTAAVLSLGLLSTLSGIEIVRSRNLPVAAEWVGDRVVTRNAYGRVCRQIELKPGSNPGPCQVLDSTGEYLAVANLDGTGPNEILVVHCGTPTEADQLSAFDRNGRKLWTMDAGLSLGAGEDYESADLKWLAFYRLPNLDGRPLRILGLRRSAAGSLSLLDLLGGTTGAVIRTYANGGHIEAIWETAIEGATVWGAGGTEQATACGLMVVLDPFAMTEFDPLDGGSPLPLASPSCLGEEEVLCCLRFPPSQYSLGVRVACYSLCDGTDIAKRISVGTGGDTADAVNFYVRWDNPRTPVLTDVQLTDILLNHQLEQGRPLTRETRRAVELRLANAVEWLTPSGWTQIAKAGL